ncbi:MAG: HAD family hydrolase [Clostridia bacterium]|nr:HAD family hydrolase [Clostridia bacterium]
MKKLCIFDLDGTLLNTLPTIAYYGNNALEAYGLPPIELERYKILVGDGRDMLIHRMLKEYESDTLELYEKVGAVYDAAYEADYMFKTEPYDGIDELLAALSRQGIKLAVLSNKPHNVAKVIVEKIFPNIFCEIWGKRPDYPTKPSPEAALEICSLAGTAADETVFIGDTSVDIITGKNAHFHTIGCEWGFRTKAELENAGADLIAKTPAEIIEYIKK